MNTQPTTSINVNELKSGAVKQMPLRVNDIKAETDKAILWTQVDEVIGTHGTWIPKSQIQGIAAIVDDSGKTLWTGLLVPAWLHNKAMNKYGSH